MMSTLHDRGLAPGVRVRLGGGLSGVVIGPGRYYDGIPGVWVALDGTTRRDGMGPLQAMLPAHEVTRDDAPSDYMGPGLQQQPRQSWKT